MNDSVAIRQALLEFLDRDLVGPAGGENEVLDDPPRIRYLAGVLFPQESTRNESDAAGGIEDASIDQPNDDLEEADVDLPDEDGEGSSTVSDGGHEANSEYDDTLTLANTYRPSAMGLSFFLSSKTEKLKVDVRAAEYKSRTEKDSETGYSRTKWDRVPIGVAAISVDLSDEQIYPECDWQLATGLKLKGVFRTQPNGQVLTTLSMYNTSKDGQKDAHTFFQCGLDVSSADGEPVFVEYRSAAERFENVEEAGLALLYRNRREFAVGHGCAVRWIESDSSSAASVSTTVLPFNVVPPVNPVSHQSEYLDMNFLRGKCEDPATQIPAALSSFCDSYDEWISALEQKALDVSDYEPAPARHISFCRTALGRMRAGVNLLESDPKALQAFMIANRTMLMQQYHARLRRGLEDDWQPLPAGETSYTSDWSKRQGYWRTFQIAFILMNLPGVTSETSSFELDGEQVFDRDLVDLIWFPTGGGKTEAYLGLAAYVIFRRRIDGVDEKGCKILMRYTLRLLTSQQFQRAASLICACELVRREDPELFGKVPITVGLYVGLSLTPNKEKVALTAIGRMTRKGKEEKNPFQLLHCPWCGTELNNETKYGYSDRRGRMIFLCPSKTAGRESPCPFSERVGPLPVCVVDESIYKDPPTLLIATVDKLAMLAWLEDAGSIFKVGGGPELIIQDELHLISGPLGSMVGLYEGVFEYLCRLDGSKPKVVASTATIRRADDQCRALYDRPMFQFPPPGLDASDSFFSKEDRNAPGRLYLGFLPTAASSPLTAQIRSIVAMQQGILLVSDSHTPDAEIDPYWTLVQYFGSLKELGHAATFVTADIPEFLPTMHRRFDIPADRKRWMRSSEELTSRKNEDEIPKILKKLEVRYRDGAARHEQALDTLLATNMISVGVDVDRLGLMLVVTQPKGTSEYIQASSRVGRSADSPGLVFTLYNAARPRDRSHYEHFSGYHQAYYRFVEPTSVTPFSPPAMQRALHAVLVIAGRHISEWSVPRDMSSGDPSFVDFLQFLRERVKSIDPDHLPEFDEIVEARLDDWASRPVDKWGDFSESSDDPVLMRPAGRPPRDHDRFSWETPTSMRNVDVECVANVLPRFPAQEVDDG